MRLILIIVLPFPFLNGGNVKKYNTRALWGGVEEGGGSSGQTPHLLSSDGAIVHLVMDFLGP